MAKLKCDTHKLRVFAINGQFIHRGGWGGVCPSKTATIGEKTYTPAEVESLKGGEHTNSAKKLLKDVFGG